MPSRKVLKGIWHQRSIDQCVAADFTCQLAPPPSCGCHPSPAKSVLGVPKTPSRWTCCNQSGQFFKLLAVSKIRHFQHGLFLILLLRLVIHVPISPWNTGINKGHLCHLQCSTIANIFHDPTDVLTLCMITICIHLWCYYYSDQQNASLLNACLTPALKCCLSSAFSIQISTLWKTSKNTAVTNTDTYTSFPVCHARFSIDGLTNALTKSFYLRQF